MQGFQAAYAELYGKAKHTVVKPGDKIPIAGLDWRIVSSAGECAESAAAGWWQAKSGVRGRRTEGRIANRRQRSVGRQRITFGQFRAIDLGDLLWNKENDLMCPNNPIGTVDAYFVTHHGLDQSGSPALVHGPAAAGRTSCRTARAKGPAPRP